LPSLEGLKSQLEAKEAIIACLQEEVKKLLSETEDKSLEIAKQSLKIQQLRRQQSHALIVDDVRGPLNVDAHAHNTNMLVDNDVTENVHVPSEPTSQIQDPPDLNEIIQLREDNNVLKRHISEMSEQYYQWKVACIFTMDRNR
jgi:hypothetical protein